MPTRRKPQTDELRDASMTKAKDKNDSLEEADVFLSAPVVARLNITQPAYATAMLNRGAAMFNQTNSTADLDAKRERARMLISHFIQTFNLGVARGVFPASARAFFHLEVSSTAVPDLGTDEKIHTWGNRIVVGDPLRVTAGGTAMALPSAAEVTTAFNAYKTTFLSHSNLKDAYDTAMLAVADLRQEADDLIMRIWNEVETYYSEEEPSNKRKKAREWGVIYQNVPGENSLVGRVTDTNNNPVEGAEVKIDQLLVTELSNANGEYSFPVLAAGTYSLTITKAAYQTKAIPGVVIYAGILTTLDIQLIPTSGSLQCNVTNNGLPLSGAIINIEALGLTVTTGSNGIGILNAISPGTYVINISKPNYQVQTIPSVIINAGGLATINVELISTTGILIANVFASGQPLAGATVRIDVLAMQVVTGSDGIGRLEGIVPGTYNVSASAPEKTTVNHSITIDANTTSSLTFDLVPVS